MMAKPAGLLAVLVVSGLGIALSAASVSLVTFPPGGTTTSISGPVGALAAAVSVGPTQPVCRIQPAEGTPPANYNSTKAAIIDSSGSAAVYPLAWRWGGCYEDGTLTTSLAPGSYTFNLTNCAWEGCKSALPKTFDIYAGQTTGLNVSIFTGIV